MEPDHKHFTTYLTDYFKTNRYFLVDDKINIDDVHYSLSLEYNDNDKEFFTILTPSFKYDCGKYQEIKISVYNDLKSTLENLKDHLDNIHIFLYALDTIDTTILTESCKNEYKARLELLKYLDRHSICYVCREPTLNTEHPRGCSHTIHFKCLYQMSVQLKSEWYTCGICRKQVPWYQIFKKE